MYKLMSMQKHAQAGQALIKSYNPDSRERKQYLNKISECAPSW